MDIRSSSNFLILNLVFLFCKIFSEEPYNTFLKAMNRILNSENYKCLDFSSPGHVVFRNIFESLDISRNQKMIFHYL